MNINGRQLHRSLGKILYRCEICHAELEYSGAGLICLQNRDHKGFIHRDEVKAIQETQKQNINELNNFYSIKDGKVVIKNGD
jgi:hypothetical protein